MANTTPDNIYYPTRDDMVAPLETVFATAAASMQTALNTRAIRNYRWDTDAQRTAQTSMRKGDKGTVLADLFEWTYDGTKWTRDVRISSGYRSTGTDIQGDVVIAHNLGVNPTSVAVTGGITGIIPYGRGYTAHSFTSTQFKVRVIRRDTNQPFLTNPVDFYWTATA